MWDAEVYLLAILIAFFSGAWPYMKLALMGVCWITPSGVMSVSRREGCLKMLDVLGKWSLIDFFVMVMMMAAFMFNLVLGDNLAIHVTVVPTFGFYGFLLATMISMGMWLSIFYVLCSKLSSHFLKLYRCWSYYDCLPSLDSGTESTCYSKCVGS